MRHELEPSNPNSLTRRGALLRALQGTVAAAVAAPAIVQAAPPTPVPLPEPDYVPENDYPLFGGELPESYGEQR